MSKVDVINPPMTEVADRLHSAAIHLLRRVRKQDPALGIGPAQASALSVLVFAGPRSLGDLAEAEGVRPPTMSRIVDGLVRSGLVRRRRGNHDGRSVLIEATARGEKLLWAGRRRRVGDLAKRLSKLDGAAVETLAAAAGIIEAMSAPQR
ncbi:MAG TPA: MarR family transcriptional regulator [Gemmatimonadales bacterium]|nr:MarR family transcriptional regulator [Gemmatimonadales bacterium]